MSGPLTPRQGLVAFMATLAGPEPAGFLELRQRRSDGSGMRQRFFDAAKPNAAAMAATVLSRTGDVYVGCALRSERAGGKDAVQQGWALWVDCDDAQAIAALARFEPQPPIVVRSSGRGRHAYWPLEQPLAAPELERANRRLAHALRACQSAVTNAAAVLRPPATLNYKYEPPAPVTLERYSGERFAAERVTGCLADPPVGLPHGLGVRMAGPFIALDARSHEATADNVRRDISLLPGMLQRIDDWIAEGVLGGQQRTLPTFRLPPACGSR